MTATVPPLESSRVRGRAWAVFLSYLGVAAALTFPVVLHLFSSSWLGVERSYGRDDLYNHIWNYWLLESGELLRSSGPFGHTDLLFFPQGFDLSLHTLNLIQMVLAWLLGRVAGWVSGFNLANLVLLALSAHCAFVLLLDLVNDRWVAWYGGLVFGFTPWSLFHTTLHPDLMTLFPLPLLLLGLFRASRPNASWRWSGLAGLALGVSAFSGLYLFAIAAFTCAMAIVGTGLSARRWREAGFRWNILVLLAVALLIVTPRVLPMLLLPGDLEDVLEQKFSADSGVDALRLFLPMGNPLFSGAQGFRDLSGPDVSILVAIVPVLLALYGATGGDDRRRARGWLALAALFLVLVLGSTLAVGGLSLPVVPMPRDLLTWLLPVPFQAFRESKLFFLGVPLPLAVSAAYGLKRLVRRRTGSRRGPYLCMAAGLLTLAECWLGPFQAANLEASPFYRRLAAEPGELALVELPFGRKESKRYAYYQTIHHRPIQEGSISRETATARRWLSSNALFATWEEASRAGLTVLDCSHLEPDSLSAAAAELIALGFRYAAVHEPAPGAIRDTFSGITPIYTDERLSAFELSELAARPPCRQPPPVP